MQITRNDFKMSKKLQKQLGKCKKKMKVILVSIQIYTFVEIIETHFQILQVPKEKIINLSKH